MLAPPSQPAMMVRQPVGLTPGMSSMAPPQQMGMTGGPPGIYGGAPPAMGGMYPPQQMGGMGGMYGPGAGMPMQSQGFPPQQGGYGGFPPPGSYPPRGMQKLSLIAVTYQQNENVS